APAEPFSMATSSGRSGSAGASPSLQGSAIDSLRTGLPRWLKDHHERMESEYGQSGTSYLLEIIFQRRQYRTWRCPAKDA
ncbi:MAG: hypothetical protein ACK50J_03245, partial [Planctomyces sp.]